MCINTAANFISQEKTKVYINVSVSFAQGLLVHVFDPAESYSAFAQTIMFASIGRLRFRTNTLTHMVYI